jgi:hypothetical protein
MGENMTDFTDTEENWMKDQGINTTYRKLFWSRMRKAMGDRREFDGPLPDGVTEDRRKNDELHEMEKLVKDIHAATKKNGNMLKSVMNVFGFAGGEAKRHKD